VVTQETNHVTCQNDSTCLGEDPSMLGILVGPAVTVHSG
jgi:hypothetical protein